MTLDSRPLFSIRPGLYRPADHAGEAVPASGVPEGPGEGLPKLPGGALGVDGGAGEVHQQQGLGVVETAQDRKSVV